MESGPGSFGAPIDSAWLVHVAVPLPLVVCEGILHHRFGVDEIQVSDRTVVRSTATLRDRDLQEEENYLNTETQQKKVDEAFSPATEYGEWNLEKDPGSQAVL